jgi:hypothetical protein
MVSNPPEKDQGKYYSVTMTILIISEIYQGMYHLIISVFGQMR